MLVIFMILFIILIVNGFYLSFVCKEDDVKTVGAGVMALILSNTIVNSFGGIVSVILYMVNFLFLVIIVVSFDANSVLSRKFSRYYSFILLYLIIVFGQLVGYVGGVFEYLASI